MGMETLANDDVFGKVEKSDVEIVKEYFERNERKKADEVWLDKAKPVIRKILMDANREKMDFDGIRVSVVTPDTSKFDMDKVVSFLLDNGMTHILEEETKLVVKEENLEGALETGDIDLDVLKAAAWVESKGTPRLTVKQVD